MIQTREHWLTSKDRVTLRMIFFDSVSKRQSAAFYTTVDINFYTTVCFNFIVHTFAHLHVFFSDAIGQEFTVIFSALNSDWDFTFKGAASLKSFITSVLFYVIYRHPY